MELIRFCDVTLGYEQMVLQHVDFGMQRGRITVFLGPNGVGKSTLFAAACGLLKPMQGSIEIDGDPRPKQLARTIAMVPQSAQVSFAYRVFDMVLWGRAPYISYLPGKEDEAIATRMMQRLGITHLADKVFNHLSGGERQMVMIARALAQQTPVILMDEPATFLDLANQTKILRLVRQLNREDGITFGITVHDPNHALYLADDVALVQNHTVRYGAARELLTEHTIERLFGVPVRMGEEDGERFLRVRLSDGAVHSAGDVVE